VSLISQASSEHSICFSVPEALAADAQESLTREFSGEIARGEIDGVELTPDMATVAVVGLGMHGTPGIAAAVFGALAAARINVVAIAQGSSELNISVVVRRSMRARPSAGSTTRSSSRASRAAASSSPSGWRSCCWASARSGGAWPR